MKKIILFWVLGSIVAAALVAALLVMHYGSKEIPRKPFCTADSDCIPASGCHPSSCVIKPSVRVLEEPTICTQECRPNTLDCGQGTCACVNLKCVPHFT